MGGLPAHTTERPDSAATVAEAAPGGRGRLQRLPAGLRHVAVWGVAATAATATHLGHNLDIAPHRRLERLLTPGRDPDPLLIGYFEAGFGLGQYARGLATALGTVGEPFAVYPYGVGVRRGARNRSFRAYYDVDRAHAINVFCMAGDQTGLARRIIGSRRFGRARNILATFWELDRGPEAWRSEIGWFDEVWAPNPYVAEALATIYSGPIAVVPPCVELERTPDPDPAAFGLDHQRLWFLFTFDYNSYPERKNPLAVIQAFGGAFPEGREPVGLVVKSNGARERHEAVAAAINEAAAADARIRVIHGELKRNRVLALIASADCYVSLHRAEGFGLGMAEAMLLGKPVIATAHSGNAEFVTPATGFPVPFSLVAVPPGAYPQSAGCRWAEPDVAAAAHVMREIAAAPERARNRGEAGRAEIRARYGAATTGRAAQGRLAAIRATIASEVGRR